MPLELRHAATLMLLRRLDRDRRAADLLLDNTGDGTALAFGQRRGDDSVDDGIVEAVEREREGARLTTWRVRRQRPQPGSPLGSCAAACSL